jgi:quinol monooxygenase YgiN
MSMTLKLGATLLSRTHSEKGNKAMHARLLTAQVSPGKMDEFIQLWQNEIIPTYKEQPGWNSARLLVDREAGKAILISVWETQEGMAINMDGTQGLKVHAIIGHLLTGRPVLEHYEVAGDV